MDKEKLIAEAEQNAYKDMLLAMIDVCHPRSVWSFQNGMTPYFSKKKTNILDVLTERIKMASQ